MAARRPQGASNAAPKASQGSTGSAGNVPLTDATRKILEDLYAQLQMASGQFNAAVAATRAALDIPDDWTFNFNTGFTEPSGNHDGDENQPEVGAPEVGA